MKRISMMTFTGLLLATVFPACAQDAALEERVNKLAGALKDVIEAQDAQRRQIEALSKSIDALRERMNQSNPDVATQSDLRRLAENLREVDQKRKDDVALISKEIENLGKSIKNQRPPRIETVMDAPPRPAGNEKG
ncbi:MAG TPA: hypothetical protein PKA41_07625, partial [Verrucomicrobiota bacterium]|nr:hypothetical protein [Verrucomicrobiota bacterium]